MNYKTILGALFVMALILTACAPAPTGVSTMEPTEAQVTEAPVATDVGSVPVTGGSTVNVSESTDFGSILVDSNGLSLYLFMADTQNGGASTCGDDDGCATEWPPLLTEGDPVAGEGVDAILLGTITRDDGSLQVTYNGWPLYLFVEDTAPGDTNGQGIDEFGGLWFLVSPTGEVIQE